jgi:acetyl esterase/lipase
MTQATFPRNARKTRTIAALLCIGALLFSSPLLAVVILPTNAVLTSNVAYGSDPLQKLDVYAPKGVHGAPIVFMVHGGGWWRGDKAFPGVVQNKINHFLPKGIIFVSVNYRLSPQVGVLDQAKDVARALIYVQAHATQWGGDPNRVVVMGHSAGAHLTSLMTTAADIHKGAKPWLGNIELDSAALNVVQIMKAPHPHSLYDPIFGADPNLWAEASPTLRITAAPPPMLMVCSIAHPGSCRQTEEFVDAAYGKAVEYQTGLDHGSIDTTLGLSNQLTDAVDSFLCALGVGCGRTQAKGTASKTKTPPRVLCSLRKNSAKPCPKR